MFYFDTWCEKYIAELFPGFARHITNQSTVRFVRRVNVDGGPMRANQEFRITLSPEALRALHRASPAQAAEIGRRAYDYLYREISAKMPLDEAAETPLSFYLGEEMLQ